MAAKKGLWRWIRTHKSFSISLATVVALAGLYMTYVHTGEESLRNDIYQPLYGEIGAMDVAIHVNNMETTYSSDIYQKLIRNGNFGRIPKSLRSDIIQLYKVEGEARGSIIPIAHKISVLMPPEIAKIRNENDDGIWKEKAVAKLNTEAAAELSQGSFSMASFTVSHAGISPSIDMRDPTHLKFASPGTVTWEIADWMGFPGSASDVERIWRDTYYLGFDEKAETWNYRITRDDLNKNHITLEEFLKPAYQAIANDPQFQQLLNDNRTALVLFEKVKSSLADRVEQPKQLKDLIDLF